MRLPASLIIAAALVAATACAPSVDAAAEKAGHGNAEATKAGDMKSTADLTAPAIGPAIGAPVPAATLTAMDGSAQSLAALAGEKGVAIAFVRSADWCPFCKKQLADLNAVAAPLAAAGWTLIAVSYDDAATLSAFHKDKALSYPLFSDPGSTAIKAFGLLNTGMEEGTRFYGVPHPAIVFAGKDGTIKAVLREEGYKDRPANELVISTAKGL
jgi:peroxiredoxin